jgi:hypothetical protein
VAAEPDRTRLRVSDADRHQVAEVLRAAAGDGRIDLDELDERLAATYAARTYADLVPLTDDLPGARVPTPEPQRHRAVLRKLDRSGVWVVPGEMTVLTMLGGAYLDFREATFSTPEVVLTVNAFFGGATVIVGPSTNVVIEATGFMGGYTPPSGLVAAKLDAASPTVRIRGRAFWGGVNVERKHVPGSGTT